MSDLISLIQNSEISLKCGLVNDSSIDLTLFIPYFVVKDTSDLTTYLTKSGSLVDNYSSVHFNITSLDSSLLAQDYNYAIYLDNSLGDTYDVINNTLTVLQLQLVDVSLMSFDDIKNTIIYVNQFITGSVEPIDIVGNINTQTITGEIISSKITGVISLDE
jgi:hypothetical protein